MVKPDRRPYLEAALDLLDTVLAEANTLGAGGFGGYSIEEIRQVESGLDEMYSELDDDG